MRVGNYRGEEVHVPFSSLLPMVHPNDFVLGGWDISGEACRPARLLRCACMLVCCAHCCERVKCPTAAGPPSVHTSVGDVPLALTCVPALCPSTAGMNLADAMERAQVLDFELQKQLVPLMRDMVPLPGEAGEGLQGQQLAGAADGECKAACIVYA